MVFLTSPPRELVSCFSNSSAIPPFRSPSFYSTNPALIVPWYRFFPPPFRLSAHLIFLLMSYWFDGPPQVSCTTALTIYFTIPSPRPLLGTSTMRPISPFNVLQHLLDVYILPEPNPPPGYRAPPLKRRFSFVPLAPPQIKMRTPDSAGE